MIAPLADHDVSIVPVPRWRHMAADPHGAQCSCGWESPAYPDLETAVAAASDHLDHVKDCPECQAHDKERASK